MALGATQVLSHRALQLGGNSTDLEVSGRIPTDVHDTSQRAAEGKSRSTVILAVCLLTSPEAVFGAAHAL